MPLKRTQIELGLENMIHSQHGFDFQKLATFLAQTHYPGLEPTEWFKDGGEDAITIPSLSSDGIKRSLACSLSGTWVKVKDDCERIKQRKVSIDTLLFYTPESITNTKQTAWREKVQKDYHHDLEIVSHARIVSDLENPQNAWLCKDYLGLQIIGEPDLEALKQKIRKVSQNTLEHWKSELKFNAQSQIFLTLQLKSDDKNIPSKILGVEEFLKTIKYVRRVILKGVPGSGKTITLLQTAEKLLENEKASVPILVSLAEWAESSQDLFPFLVSRPSYSTIGISTSDLSQLNDSGNLTVLLNGWNEIPREKTTAVFQFLRGLVRESPATSFVVATRSTTINPPFSKPGIVQVEPLESRQRRKIIELASVSDPNTLINRIEAEPSIEAVTRTPLFLAGAIELTKQGKALPDSRYGILRALVDLTESNLAHQLQLKTGACKGHHRFYLVRIATKMCGSYGTSLKGELALSSVADSSHSLFQKGWVGIIPDGFAVLESLTSAHLLVREETDHSFNMRFVHQQFQEWFAAEEIYEQLVNLSEDPSTEEFFQFQRDIVNEPSWEEALKFLAERINPKNKFEQASNLADTLIGLIIPIDLLFAAQLANIAGWDYLGGPRHLLADALRSLYAKQGSSFQDYALAAMLATGSPDFSEIFSSLYQNEDSRVRQKLFIAHKPFPLSCLGNDPSQLVSSWDEDRRLEFVRDVLWDSDGTNYEIAVHFASKDSSQKVRIKALQALAWNWNVETVIQIIKDENFGPWPDELFAEVLGLIPTRDLAEIRAVIKSSLGAVTTLSARLFILKYLNDVEDIDADEFLKKELDPNGADFLLTSLIPRIHQKDPEWVAHWLTEKMLQGYCWETQWVKYLDKVTPEAIVNLTKAAYSTELDINTLYRRLDVLKKVKDDAIIPLLVSEYLEKEEELRREPGKRSPEGDRVRTLFNVLREASFEYLVRACRSFDESPSDPFRIDAILYLLGPHTPWEEELRPALSPEDARWLRDLVFKWDQELPPQPEDQRRRRANQAILLGAIGEPEDAGVLEKWIEEDLQSRKVTKSATSWSNWYAGALTRLKCPQATHVLQTLLGNSEYLGDASAGLWNLVRSEMPPAKQRLFGRLDYGGIHEARQLRISGSISPSHPNKCQYAQAIAEALALEVEKLEGQNKKPFSPWVLLESTVALAHLGEEEHISLILKIGNIDALTVLVNKGILIPGSEIYKTVNPIITKLENDPRSYSGNDWWLAERCFALLLFSDEPRLGVERIQQLPDTICRSYKMRELIRLLGLCRAQEAAEYLAEIAEKYEILKFCMAEYLDSLVIAGKQISSETIFRIFEDLKAEKIDDNELKNVLILHLGKALGQVSKQNSYFLGRIKVLCEQATKSDENKILLEALETIGTEEAAKWACLLARDDGSMVRWDGPPLVIQDSLINKIPGELTGSYYEQSKSSNEIRKVLLEQALNDSQRKRTSLALLVWIENKRLELGRPMNETRHPNVSRLGEIGMPWPLWN